MKLEKTINGGTANRALLRKINTNISTLRYYIFDLEGDGVKNSTFPIEMEEKMPHIVYIKWEDEKPKYKLKQMKSLY